MNIVLIPCYNRPEFLHACIEYIKRADGYEKNHYHFAVEHNADRGIQNVLTRAMDTFDHMSVSKQKQRISKGNQMNVMEGYKHVAQLMREIGSELIFNIEPDIFIAKGFFEYHRLANELCPDAFYVSACHNQNWTRKVPKYLDKVYYHSSFQSLGLSFKPEIVDEIAQHATLDYYRNPVQYLDKVKFPTSKRKGIHHEQAGLIHRIQEFSKNKGVYPCNPLAYHAGFYGVNRPGEKLTGSTNEKARQLMAMSAEEMNSRAKKYKDIKSIDLGQESPESLTLLDLPEEINIGGKAHKSEGYDESWAKRGIKVRSKPRRY
jgi:hypothetical protein